LIRGLAVLVVAGSGCIISAPDGAPQAWPPPLEVSVQAVTAGDLDGNGSTDVVVYGTGSDSQAGMYLLAGGKDLGGGTTTPVRGFSKFVPASFVMPTAALQLSGTAPSIYVATADDGAGDKVGLTQYTNVLTQTAHVTTTVPTGNPALWVHLMMFPGMMPHIAVSNSGSIDHVAASFSEVRAVPAPGTPTWDAAQLATSYASGTDQIAVVATATQIQRATIPGPTGGMFGWAVVRTGPAWLGQVSLDLDGDGREEIIGLDVAGKQVCVVDPGATTVPVTPTCLSIPILAPGDEVQLFIGTNITMNPGPDILIAQASNSDTQYMLVEDYTYTPGSLTASLIHGVPIAGPSHGRTVIANNGPGTPNSVLVFSTGAAATCVMGPC
jgi:hypothetical protein